MKSILNSKLKKVDSSSILGFSYDEELKTLLVEFANQSKYVYGNVPKTVVLSCFDPDNASVGKSFFKCIRGKYTCVRLS